MKKIIIYFSLILNIVFIFSGLSVYADSSSESATISQRKVNVGYFYEPGYHQMTSTGDKYGYGFELIENMNIFAGFDIEYVGYNKNWADMFQMLKNGQIDVLSCVNWSQDRADDFLFSDYDVGTSSFIISVPEDSRINSIEELINSGKNIYIGVRQGDIATRHLIKYAKETGLKYTFVYYSDDNSLKKALLDSDKIDVVLASSFRDISGEKIIESFDDEPVYIITRKDDVELMNEINDALEILHYIRPNLLSDLKSKYYSIDLDEGYYYSFNETKYIHDNKDRTYVALVTTGLFPFAYYENGELKGILPDIAELIFQKAELNVEIIGIPADYDFKKDTYANDADIIIDSLYDFNSGISYNEMLSLPYLEFDLVSVSYSKNKNDEEILGYVLKSESLYFERNVLFSDLSKGYYSLESALNALRSGEITKLITPLYAAYEIVRSGGGDFYLDEYYKDTYSMAFAIKNADDYILPGILSKTISYADNSEIQSIITSYIEITGEVTLVSFLKSNPWILLVLIIILVLVASVIIILLYKARASAKEHALLQENLAYIRSIVSSNELVIISEQMPDGSILKYQYRIDENSTNTYGLVKDIIDEDVSILYRLKVHPDDIDIFNNLFSDENYKYVSESNISKYVELRLISTEGIYEYYSISMHGMFSANSRGKTLTIFKNINKAKLEEEEKRKTLVLALENAKRFSASKTMFLSQMSHDIRTPMNAILGMATIAKLNIDNKNKVEECLNIIDNSSQHLLSLINEILDVSRIESGKLSISNSQISLKDAFESVVNLHKDNIINSGIACDVSLDIRNENVYTDRTRLIQVFTNIISNAAKYTLPGGSIYISLKELDMYETDTHFYEFCVADTGIGMSEDMLSKLFSPFERANEVEFVEGTGLGMTITKNIVDALGGVINVTSEEKVGTTVTVSIGFSDKSEASLAEIKELQDKTALIISEDTDITDAFRNIFSEGKMQVRSFSDISLAKECINSLRDEKNLKIIVVSMPMDQGREIALLKELRKEYGDEFILIAVTGNHLSANEISNEDFLLDGISGLNIYKQQIINIVSAGLKRINNDKKLNIESTAIGKKALIVEDVEINAIFAEAIAEMKGLEAEIAHNGEEAVKMLEESSNGYYSIVLMDIQMPVMNGYEASKKIRASKRKYLKSIPIIAMSANAYEEDVLKAKEAGMNDHIAKPVDINVFSAIVDKYVKD